MIAKQRLLTAVLLAAILAVGGAWLFLRGQGVVDATVALQMSLLAGERAGRDRAAGVIQVTRNVDKMDRDDVKKVRDAFTAEWRRLQRQGVDEYAAAVEADRDALLDRDIDRLVTAGELWFATNPRSSGLPPKPRKAKQPERKKGPAKVNPAAELLAAYRAALLSRAGKRGVSVPEWLLGSR